MSRYLLIEAVAERYGGAVRTIHRKAELGLIPHRRLPGTRRLLFDEEHLAAFEDGAELERVDLPGGGRIVRPKGEAWTTAPRS